MKRWLRIRGLTLSIQWHWFWIGKCQKAGVILLEAGETLSSRCLNTLNRRMSKHCAKQMIATSQYERLTNTEGACNESAR